MNSFCDKFPGVLLDAYGVFWGGNAVGLLPGAKEAMEKLMLQGKIVGILSNTTQFADVEKAKLKKAGLIEGTHFHFLVTSGEIARALFLNNQLPFKAVQKRYWLFGTPHPRFSSPHALFEGTGYTQVQDISRADFIHIAIPHIEGEDQTDPSCFTEEVRKILHTQLPMVCTNPDHFAHEGTPPRLVVRQGTIAALYEEMGGSVWYIGKPSKTAFEFAMEQFKQHGITHPEKVVMIGDTPGTDIRGAKQFSMASVLITGTGVVSERIAKSGYEQIVQSLTPSEYPDYFLERFHYDFI